MWFCSSAACDEISTEIARRAVRLRLPSFMSGVAAADARSGAAPPSSTACPFSDAYHFVYSNNSGGFCRNPVSYVRPCSPQSRLVFHFRHCSDAAYTHDRGRNELPFRTFSAKQDQFERPRPRPQDNSDCWRRGVVVSGVRRINEVNARRARLVPGWVTVFGRVYHRGM